MRDRQVGEKMVSVKKCVRTVAEEVIGVWEKASIPTKGIDKVEMAITKLWSTKDKLRKDKMEMGTLQNMQLDMTSLFDASNTNVAPEHEGDVAFLEDQRGPRSQIIGGVDKETTALWMRRDKRRQRDAATSRPASQPPTSGAWPRLTSDLYKISVVPYVVSDCLSIDL